MNSSISTNAKPDVTSSILYGISGGSQEKILARTFSPPNPIAADISTSAAPEYRLVISFSLIWCIFRWYMPNMRKRYIQTRSMPKNRFDLISRASVLPI